MDGPFSLPNDRVTHRLAQQRPPGRRRARALSRGLNGPTVVDIMNGGEHVAVHAVVPASGVYRIVAELKALEAEGILVTRIERLIP